MLEDQEENIKDDVEYIHVHQDVIDSVQDKMPEEETLYDLAELFKIFGDSTRIRILYVLFESEMCVYDIAQLLSMTQSAISHQLRILRQAKIVRSRRVGKQIYYSIEDNHVGILYSVGMEHILEGR